MRVWIRGDRGIRIVRIWIFKHRIRFVIQWPIREFTWEADDE